MCLGATLSVSRVAKSHDTVKGTFATRVRNALTTFFGVQRAVDEVESNIDWIEGTIRVWNTGHDAGTAFRRAHLMIEKFTGERLRLCQIFLISAINVDGRIRITVTALMALPTTSSCSSPSTDIRFWLSLRFRDGSVVARGERV